MSELYFGSRFSLQVVIHAYSSLHTVGFSAWVDDTSDFDQERSIEIVSL